jgi:hypothetical protein
VLAADAGEEVGDLGDGVALGRLAKMKRARK